MQIIHDYFIVALDRIFDVQTTKKGIITLNEAYIEEGERDRNIYKRIYGTVASVPRGYTHLNIDPLDPGVPNHRIFVGHDVISGRVNEGYKWSREEHYHPGTTESYEFKTLADVAKLVDVKIGDRVYAHPNVFEAENALWKKDGKYYFRVRADEIICSVVGGKICAQAGNVIVEPFMETWEEITRPSGIVIKPSPEAKPLQGKVRFSRDGSGIPVGELIFFEKDANWTVGIEGKEYYIVKEEECLCTFEN